MITDAGTSTGTRMPSNCSKSAPSGDAGCARQRLDLRRGRPPAQTGHISARLRNRARRRWGQALTGPSA